VLQPAERLLAESRGEPALPKPPVDLRGCLLATRDRPERGLDGTRASQLARELAQARAVELLPHVEPDTNDDLGRDRAPARSVELDGDPAAS
jgi:hypothetical protein